MSSAIMFAVVAALSNIIANPEAQLAAAATFAAVASGYAIFQVARYVRARRRRWLLVDVRSEFTEEHHIPSELPIPRDQAERVRKGDLSVDEAVEWLEQFVKQCPRHKRTAEYRSVLRKLDLYRQVATNMGKGMWREVDSLAQRLAELDPLDPSADVTRARAMRELGNFAGAIRCYQKALERTPFHSMAFPELAATCRTIGQPGRFRKALEKARKELGDTHPLTIEGRIQLGELVRIYTDPIDPATLAHVPREQYLQNVQHRLNDMTLDHDGFLQVGMSLLDEDMPELAGGLAKRCEEELGVSAQSLLLQGMVQHYRLRLDAAEALVRKSLHEDDTAVGRLELARIMQAKARRDAATSFSTRFMEQSRQQLRLAIERDPNLVEAIGLLVEPSWAEGIDALSRAIGEIAKAYPEAWAPWRVLGDAYATEGQRKKAIEFYRRGLRIADADGILLPCMSVMEEEGMHDELYRLARRVRRLHDREPQLRWRIAQAFCQREKYNSARKVLQNLVDDERVSPQLRQRADDVLDQLDAIEREGTSKKRSKPKANND